MMIIIIIIVIITICGLRTWWRRTDYNTLALGTAARSTLRERRRQRPVYTAAAAVSGACSCGGGGGRASRWFRLDDGTRTYPTAACWPGPTGTGRSAGRRRHDGRYRGQVVSHREYYYYNNHNNNTDTNRINYTIESPLPTPATRNADHIITRSPKLLCGTAEKTCTDRFSYSLIIPTCNAHLIPATMSNTGSWLGRRIFLSKFCVRRAI